jgi:hypothetical protein
MADVFISYSQKDREVAQALGDFLTEHGYDIWWDYELVGGVKFRNAIKAELTAAKAAIVIWSAHSIESDWVIEEAEEAKYSNKLIATRIEGLDYRNIPLGFRGVQTDLVTEPERILRALANLGISPSHAPAPPSSAPVAIGQTVDPDAIAKAEQFAHWEFIKDSQDPADFDRFLDMFPASTFAALARAQLERLAARAWQDLSNSEDIAALEGFVRTFHKNARAADADVRLQTLKRALEDTDWNSIQRERHPAPFLRFLVSHPTGAHAEDAVAVLTKLPKALEEDAWVVVKDCNEPIVLRGFLAALPHSSHARDVATRLGIATPTSGPSPPHPAPTPIPMPEDRPKAGARGGWFWLAIALLGLVVLTATGIALAQMGYSFGRTSVAGGIATAVLFLSVMMLLLFLVGPRLYSSPSGSLLERMLFFHVVASIGLTAWIWIIQAIAEANWANFGNSQNTKTGVLGGLTAAIIVIALVGFGAFRLSDRRRARIVYYLVVFAIGLIEFSLNRYPFPAANYWLSENLLYCGGLALLLFAVAGLGAEIIARLPPRAATASGPLPPAA